MTQTMPWYDTSGLYQNNPYNRSLYAQGQPAPATPAAQGQVTGSSWAMQALANAGPYAAPTMDPTKAWGELSNPKTLTPSGPTPQSPNAAGLTAPAQGATSTKLAQVTPAATSQAATPQAGAFDWYTRPGYTWGGDAGWINPTRVAKGTPLAPGVGLPVDYDPTKDTYRTGVNGTQESAMQRAMRWAKDMVAAGTSKNYQNLLAFAMANLSSDWQRGQVGQQKDWVPGTNLGWDPNAFRYNTPGEAYNDAIDYAAPTKRFVNGQPVTAATTPPAPPATTATTATTATPTPTTPTTSTTPTPGGTTVAGGHFDPATGQWVPDPGAPTTGAGVPTGAYYQSNPQVAVTNFLAQHGLTPDSHSPFADMLRKLGAGLAPVIAQTIGMGSGAAGAMDQLNQLPQMLTDLIYGNGGKTFSNVGGYGDSVLKNVAGAGPNGQSFLHGMDFSAVENLLKTITSLKGLGMNQYMQNYQQNALQSGLDRYGAADLANQGQTNAGDWLLQNDPYNLFGFAKAGGGVGAGGTQNRS